MFKAMQALFVKVEGTFFSVFSLRYFFMTDFSTINEFFSVSNCFGDNEKLMTTKTFIIEKETFESMKKVTQIDTFSF